MPAIQTLAKFYGVSIPGLDGSISADLQVATGASTSVSHSVSVGSDARSKGKGKEVFAGRANEEYGDFLPLPQDGSKKCGILNPFHESGCMNCNRRKSATWRARKERNGRTVSVCNRKFEACDRIDE